MSDFNFVTDRIATGAAVTTLDDVQQLYDAGVTHIIDCRDDFDDTALFAQWVKENHHRIKVLWNGTADDGTTKPPSWFHTSVDFAITALSHHHTAVYAHCAAGVNRGPSTCYAILRSLGLDPTAAENMIRMARPSVGLAYARDADAAYDAIYKRRAADAVFEHQEGPHSA